MLSMCANLGILGFFKYCNFFAESFHDLMLLFGWQVDGMTLQVVLPVGISFYTFQTMSYTIDIYRKEIEPTYQFLDFALFVTFFPQLVAGPVERAKHLLPQVLKKRSVTQEQFNQGCWLIALGLFKKVFVADNLARIVDPVFSHGGSFSGAEVLMAVYAFAFQIYGDFSGYSDIARGVSKLLGFNLMLNFRMPYFASNVSKFWRRWHISLSTWLRDYLYISLGGSQGRRLFICRNLFLTMALGGLWHGASWNFVLWGMFHGVALIIHRVCSPALSSFSFQTAFSRNLWRLMWTCVTFHTVCLGWLLFRAQSFSQITQLLDALFFNFHVTQASLEYAKAIVFYTSFLLLLQLIKEVKKEMYVVFTMPAWVRGGVYLFLLISIALAGAKGGQEFIYFQF